MTYYLANLEFGEDHTVTATYRVLSFTFRHGTQHHKQLAELIPSIPMTLELTSPGGATPSSTPEAPQGGPTAGT